MTKTTTTTATTDLTICRKCGVTLKADQIASTSVDGKAHTGFCCIGAQDKKNVILPAGNTSVPVSEKNLTARANPSLAPKPTAPAITSASAAPKVTAPKVVKEPTLDTAKQAEFDQVVSLIKAGKKTAEIATAMSLTYGRVVVLTWFNHWMGGTAPGCKGYTAAGRADAQKRYEAKVAANKAAKTAPKPAAPIAPAIVVPVETAPVETVPTLPEPVKSPKTTKTAKATNQRNDKKQVQAITQAQA